MPFKYVRKTAKASWSNNDMSRALAAVKSGVGIRKAARQHGVPYGTLQDRLKGKVPNEKCNMGRKPIFSPEHEKELCEQIIALSKRFYGVTPKQVRKIAYEFAEKNQIRHNFNTETKMCGFDWYYGFLKRNPKISLRKPEATSLNRVLAFNATEVKIFFDNLSSLYDKYNFSPNRIYNVDETGVTNVHTPGRILAVKGQKQVGAITSGERGKLTTVICAANASGDYIPPMFIFGRGKMSYELTKNGPTNAIYKVSKNGWVNEDLFFEWLQHFASYSKCSVNDPVLLVMDNHSSHCTLKVFDYCKENGIVILTLPPHTSHRLQPLDICFYGPLKTAYNQECDNFMKSNNYQRIQQSDIAQLFKNAYNRTATIQKAVKGFESAGIYPFNPNTINPEELSTLEEPEQEGSSVGGDKSPEDRKVQKNRKIEATETDYTNPRPGPSGIHKTQNIRSRRSATLANNSSDSSENSESELELVTDLDATDDEDKSIKPKVSFSELLPIPNPKSLRDRKQNSKRKHSQIFTVTPNREDLESKEKIKLRKLSVTANKQVKRNLTETNREDIKNDRENKKPKNKNKQREVATEPCTICEEYGKDGEWWVTCSSCVKSSHAECAGWDISKPYICDFCCS